MAPIPSFTAPTFTAPATACRAPGKRSWALARTLLNSLALLGVLLGASSSAWADVSVRVQKIYASTEREFVDPKLSDLKAHFSRFGMFTSFTADQTEEVIFKAEGDERTVDMPDGKKLKLIFRGESKGYVKLRFELGDMKMNVRIHDGGLFFHSGVTHRKGRMVLAIRAKHQNGAAISRE